jgi:hypothetical protein
VLVKRKFHLASMFPMPLIAVLGAEKTGMSKIDISLKVARHHLFCTNSIHVLKPWSSRGGSRQWLPFLRVTFPMFHDWFPCSELI